MRYEKALVTGGAGFIGSHLVRGLLRHDLEVVVIDNLLTGKREKVPPEAAFIKGDILDIELIERITSQVDIVFHLAAVVSVRSSVKEFYADAQTNIIGTLNLLQGCIRGKRVRKFIYASSMAVYADSPDPCPISETYTTEPLSPYGVSKLASEKYVLQVGRQENFDTVVLRYFNTYGPGQTFTPYVGVITIFVNRLLARKPPIIFGDGEQRRDFIHAGDVVEATIRAMEEDITGEICNVGTGVATSVNEITQMLCSRIDPEIKPVRAEGQPGELKNSVADISKARKILKLSPQFRIEEKIDEVIKSIRVSGNKQSKGTDYV